MQEIAQRPLTVEQREQFEKEARQQHQDDYEPKKKRSSRKGKGEKARNRRQFA